MGHLEYPPSIASLLHRGVFCVKSIKVTQGSALCYVVLHLEYPPNKASITQGSVLRYVVFYLEYPPNKAHGCVCVPLHVVSLGVPTQYAIRVTQGGHLCSVTWCSTWGTHPVKHRELCVFTAWCSAWRTHPVRHQSYTGRWSVFGFMVFHLEDPPSTPSELHREVIFVWLHGVPPTAPTQ